MIRTFFGFTVFWFVGSIMALLYAGYYDYLEAERIIVTSVGMGVALGMVTKWWK